MKIAIDVSQVVYETGVSVYTKELVKHLLLLDNKNEYLLFGGSLRGVYKLKAFFDSLGFHQNLKTKIIPISPSMADFIWNRVHRLHIEKIIGKVDVFHSSDWSQPPSNAFNVTTIHDLSPIKYPEYTPKKIVSVHKSRLSRVKKECDVIIVPSETTKKDLLDIGFNVSKIHVVYEALPNSFKKANKYQIAKMRKKLGIREKYLLCFGRNPRKNLRSVIDAFFSLKRDDLILVVIGENQNFHEDSNRVKSIPFVEAEMLPALYSGAEALVYPSIYEGFGLPVLEAFACEIPVVATNYGSIAEVGGKAYVGVDPFDVSSISAGIVKAFAKKEQLIKEGVKRLAMYSWEKTAKLTLKLYELCVQPK
ncbi:MAG: glycosyltransferase family 4 protein [Patescibacteria group bacterium]|nr:glycosyltransferase family 4 protein [Patescibacteria group bacterium]